MSLYKSSLGLAAGAMVCALSTSCGRGDEEPAESIAQDSAPETARRDVGDGEPAPSSTAAELASSRLSYEVDARSSSRFGFAENTTTESLQASYSLSVERVAGGGQFTLIITPDLESVSDGLEWVGGTLPGQWRRQYRDNGDFAGGRDPADAGVFDWATHNLFSVTHLVLSLPSIRLETGETWRHSDRHPNGQMDTELELVDVTEDRIALKSSTLFTPFARDDTFSWEETIEGSYERATRMAIEVEIRHERRLSGVTERNGAQMPISSSVTTQKTVRRVSG